MTIREINKSVSKMRKTLNNKHQNILDIIESRMRKKDIATYDCLTTLSELTSMFSSLESQNENFEYIDEEALENYTDELIVTLRQEDIFTSIGMKVQRISLILTLGLTPIILGHYSQFASARLFLFESVQFSNLGWVFTVLSLGFWGSLLESLSVSAIRTRLKISGVLFGVNFSVIFLVILFMEFLMDTPVSKVVFSLPISFPYLILIEVFALSSLYIFIKRRKMNGNNISI